ncbi:MAG: hypothetical protein JKY03_11795, partial [Aureispira sp.]|nr:hypothetical protein [Aureispira sp.]
ESVKKYYQLELSGDSTEVVKEYKERIRKEYFPNRGYGAARSSVSRKVISDFKKISIHTKDVVILLLYRTEMMLEFTIAYGDIDEAFYNSLESSYEQACKLIKSETLQVEYQIYCQELVGKANNFGWGVYEGLEDSFEECFGEKP